MEEQHHTLAGFPTTGLRVNVGNAHEIMVLFRTLKYSRKEKNNNKTA